MHTIGPIVAEAVRGLVTNDRTHWQVEHGKWPIGRDVTERCCAQAVL